MPQTVQATERLKVHLKVHYDINQISSWPSSTETHDFIYIQSKQIFCNIPFVRGDWEMRKGQLYLWLSHYTSTTILPFRLHKLSRLEEVLLNISFSLSTFYFLLILWKLRPISPSKGEPCIQMQIQLRNQIHIILRLHYHHEFKLNFFSVLMIHAKILHLIGPFIHVQKELSCN